MTKLLVATGTDYSRRIEVVNLDASKPNLVCDNLPNFPVGLEGGTGQLFHGRTPIICGGVDSITHLNSGDCYAFMDGVWNKISSLHEPRRYASSTLVSLENQEEFLMITGGRNSNSLKSVESFSYIDWDQNLFSDMLHIIWKHCLVKINSTTLLSIGGSEDGGPTSKTSFYNVEKNSWTSGPSLNIARTGLSCGILNWKNPDTNQIEKVIVAAGGSQISTVELLLVDESEANGWVMGPSLPIVAYLSTMVEYTNSVILIGGEEGVDGRTLYQLTSPKGNWVEMKQSLTLPRSRHVSFLVPDELVNCH